MSEECASGRGKGVTWIRLGDDRAETGASAKKRDNRLAAEEGYRTMASEGAEGSGSEGRVAEAGEHAAVLPG